MINLMLIMASNRKHYVAIKSLSRLLSSQNTKHKSKKRPQEMNTVRTEMPHKRPIVEYSDGQFQFKVPFIMYADFESILELIQGPVIDLMISSTRGVNNHVPFGWCICSKFAYGEVKDPLRLFREKDCV